MREDVLRHEGLGPFPARGELEGRARSVERRVDVYRLTILATENGFPARTRRTYLSSRRERDGEVEATEMNGKTFEVSSPLGACRVDRVEPDGSIAAAWEREARRVRLSAVRMAASLLPAKPVRLSEGWAPGRDLSAFASLGQPSVRIEARLKSVEDGEEGRVATVTGETDVRIVAPGRPDLLVTQRETLRTDLAAGRFLSYRIVVERHRGSALGPAATWQRTETTAAFDPGGR